MNFTDNNERDIISPYFNFLRHNFESQSSLGAIITLSKPLKHDEKALPGDFLITANL